MVRLLLLAALAALAGPGRTAAWKIVQAPGEQVLCEYSLDSLPDVCDTCDPTPE
jgi:hypothetical protein